MISKLEELRAKAIRELDSISDPKSLEAWRISYLGRKSPLTQILRGLATLPLEERRAVGAAANALRESLEQSLAQREEIVKEADIARAIERGRIDVTLPGRPATFGRLHPSTQMMRQMCDIFRAM